MKNLLIAISLGLCAQTAYSGVFDLDSNRERPILIIKASSFSLTNWWWKPSYLDVELEFSPVDRFSMIGAVGKYYRSKLSLYRGYTTGFYIDAGLRYYPSATEYWGGYWGLQYRYQPSSSLIEVDFTQAGLPYSKLITVDRNSNMFLIMFGSNQFYYWNRWSVDYSLGLGLERRFGVLTGLVSR
ncbi:hypothetical protein JYT72_00640 [Crocinitomix catalasitica]|nr:hypothetical protein [Crocinitomix catalasitica]